MYNYRVPSRTTTKTKQKTYNFLESYYFCQIVCHYFSLALQCNFLLGSQRTYNSISFFQHFLLSTTSLCYFILLDIDPLSRSSLELSKFIMNEENEKERAQQVDNTADDDLTEYIASLMRKTQS